MIRKLKEKDINNIRNFYIINLEFSLPSVMDSIMIADTKYCFGAPITKVHINKNCMNFKLFSNELAKNKIYINEPKSIPYKIINNVISILRGYPDKLDLIIQGNNLLINGTLNKGYKNLATGACS